MPPELIAACNDQREVISSYKKIPSAPYEMYSMMFENEMNQPGTGSRKGDNDNERMDEPPVNAEI